MDIHFSTIGIGFGQKHKRLRGPRGKRKKCKSSHFLNLKYAESGISNLVMKDTAKRLEPPDTRSSRHLSQNAEKESKIYSNNNKTNEFSKKTGGKKKSGVTAFSHAQWIELEEMLRGIDLNLYVE